MSDNDELVLIGQLVKDAAQAKKNTQLLKGKLENLSQCLSQASGQINGIHQGMVQGYEGEEKTMRAIPTSEEVMSTLVEFRKEKKRSQELAARIAELGI